MLSSCCSRRHNTRAFHFPTKSIQQTGRKKVGTESMHQRTHSQQTRILGTVWCCIRIIWMSMAIKQRMWNKPICSEANISRKNWNANPYFVGFSLIFWSEWIEENRTRRLFVVRKGLEVSRTRERQALRAPLLLLSLVFIRFLAFSNDFHSCHLNYTTKMLF